MTTFSVRSLYGIAMGGVWAGHSWRRVARVSRVSLSAKIPHSDLPGPGMKRRPWAPEGYILASSKLHILLIIASHFDLYENNGIIRTSSWLSRCICGEPSSGSNTPQTWNSIFWFGAGLSVLAASIRASLPEGAGIGLHALDWEDVQGSLDSMGISNLLLVSSLLAAFNLSVNLPFSDITKFSTFGPQLAHNSQDLYTTFMQASKGFSASLANEANIIGEAGALIEGALGGYLSQFLGRKVTVIFACVWSAAFIPLWILPSSWGRLSIGAFFFQVGVNITWGMLARSQYTSTNSRHRHSEEQFTGTVHQMVNMASSASARIIVDIRSLLILSRLSSNLQATAGITLRKQVNGVDQLDYVCTDILVIGRYLPAKFFPGTIQAIMAALSCVMCTFLGPERHSAHFEDGGTAIEEGVAHKDRTLSHGGEGEGEKIFLWRPAKFNGHFQNRIHMLVEQMICTLFNGRDSWQSMNPLHAILQLTRTQQALFWSGWLAWITDSFDFFCVSLTILQLQAQFNRDTHAMTTAITLTLLFRPVGAIIFGLLADRFGRKWPLVADLAIIAVLQVGTGFVTTFSEFLAVRSLFEMAMGGVWGLASAASMENLPVASRGLYSGLMQVGYPGGYLVASIVNLYLVPESPQTWRSWILPSSWTSLSVGAFFFQAGVNIAWGMVAAYFNELAPPACIQEQSTN
ncbi:hypothetical protein BDN71DRAFT_1500708 [Pleurotus eryngii]|uniref:Major facilitator superfamily (MFS) profile domain-containing protein n=1 Tax=Pleurotus eryngii TaxID=5323 RepID=A0A9P6AC17_PLEER|nr:hypothetical protein BDN71DRAFT_1500708 [Pleurotus eryngii]